MTEPQQEQVLSFNIFLALKGEDFSGQTGCSFRFDAAVTCGSTTGVFPL
ncbi:hypothetical protein SXCC_00110 [Gluconacetobacter sp. SXCC-1]|nr:hypothetical protein SXCC_00110 [Gluconacetobacter sp. SXCC-1]